MSSKEHSDKEEKEAPQVISLIKESDYDQIAKNSIKNNVVSTFEISASEKRKFVRKINKYNSYLKALINQLENKRCNIC